MNITKPPITEVVQCHAKDIQVEVSYECLNSTRSALALIIGASFNITLRNR